nr:hypothetical protein CFP56_36153 [Quercus suber]
MHGGAIVGAARPDEVVQQAQQHDAAEHDGGPVEVGGGDGVGAGHGRVHEQVPAVDDAEHVEGEAVAAERPGRVGQAAAEEAAPHQADEGDLVGGGDGHDLQGDDGVEGTAPGVDGVSDGVWEGRMERCGTYVELPRPMREMSTVKVVTTRQSVVSSKGKDLSAGRGYVVGGAQRDKDRHDAGDGNGARVRACRGNEQLEEGKASRGVRVRLRIDPAETDDQEDDEVQQPVDAVRPHHRSGDHQTCQPRLLGHMRRAVATEEGEEDDDLQGKELEQSRGAKIRREGLEDLAARRFGGEHQQHDDDGDERQDREAEDEALQQRQMLGEEAVDQKRDDHDCHHEQISLPGPWHEPGVPQRDQTGDQRADQVHTTRDADEP